jgi:Na+/melibiose symporter-like transporter
MKKAKLHTLITMNIYWFGLSFMWNSIHPIILPSVLLHIVPEHLKNSYLGALTFSGLVLAMIIQPISGAASDRWRSRWGRRRPLALVGTGLDFIFLSLLAWSGNLFVVVLGYIGLQITSNIAHGPMQGLIPDLVPNEQLGLASGLKNLLDMAGLIIASLAAGSLLSPDDRYPTMIMIVVMVILLISAAVTFLYVKEKPTSDTSRNSNKIHLKQVFQIDLKANSSYFWLIVSRFLFLVGIYGVQTFAQYYIRDVMQAANPVKATGDLMASLAIALVICSLIGGWLTDKIGARLVIFIASLISAIGAFLLVIAKDIPTLTFFAGILGAGIGLYLSSSWALASRLAPKKEAGKFLGLTNLATAGASAVSKLGGIPIDMVNNAFPGHYYGYTGLFVLGGTFALLSMLLLHKVKENHLEV